MMYVECVILLQEVITMGNTLYKSGDAPIMQPGGQGGSDARLGGYAFFL